MLFVHEPLDYRRPVLDGDPDICPYSQALLTVDKLDDGENLTELLGTTGGKKPPDRWRIEQR